MLRLWKIERRRVSAAACALALPLAWIGGCAKVTMEGGERPIHIVMDVNIKVDRQLDEFFAFQNKYEHPATQPASTQAVSEAVNAK